MDKNPKQGCLPYLTSVCSSIIPSPGQPQPPPNNQSSCAVQGSWQRGESGPGVRPREEVQHGGKVDGAVIPSRHNKCLHI